MQPLLASPRTSAAFFLFGLLNNLLYVIILSAALDLVGPTLPKAIVLLADVVPSFATKLAAPYFVHRLPYRVRVPLLVALSVAGMQLVAWQPALPARLAGVVLASVSSGLGELSFLGLSHFYPDTALVFWGSGTGAAGLVGAGLYVLATSWAGWGVRASLMAFGFLPLLMLAAFFWVLPAPAPARAGYAAVAGEDADADDDDAELGKHALDSFAARRAKVRALFVPYMLPLLLVYVAEYTINLGVVPTLLFPLAEMPVARFRDAFPLYGALYQAGVFVARSSLPLLRVRALLPPALLQLLNLLLLTAHALFPLAPSVHVLFAAVFWEGLLGGLVYVNTFAAIRDADAGPAREFALAAVTVADSAGICAAGLIALALEPALCAWQVAHGRPWCREA